jgi:large subunit ribosomal protein L31
MKPDIHPAYNVTTVTCGCGNTFTTRSTSPTGSLTVEVCSACHPFYTGKQKILDTGGRVARFEKRFGHHLGITDIVIGQVQGGPLRTIENPGATLVN